MTDEPYRYVEAINNRREYVETQLATASPVVALSYLGGILLLAMVPERQKIFEIYDRIALGVLGHPGDIERLRMTAIEIASTEGFTRSPADVSLRRLANYSFSPLLKNAFEQIYGSAFIARLLFAELESPGKSDLFIRVDYDGSLSTSGNARQPFGLVAGTRQAEQAMTESLLGEASPKIELEKAFQLGLKALAVGDLVASEVYSGAADENQIKEYLTSTLQTKIVEAAVMERGFANKQSYRSLGEEEAARFLAKLTGKKSA